jgi:hypothetical protein
LLDKVFHQTPEQIVVAFVTHDVLAENEMRCLF